MIIVMYVVKFICYFYFVLGGYNGVFYLRSVERFDSLFSEWIMVVFMSRLRIGFSVVVLNGFLYLVGGYDGLGYFSFV